MTERRNGEMLGSMKPRGLAAKAIQPMFWAGVDNRIDALLPRLNTGMFVSNTRVFEVVGGIEQGEITVETPALNGHSQSNLMIKYSCEEPGGSLSYLHATHTVVDRQAQEEISGRLQVIPREFIVIEFNPLLVVSALHAAVKAP